MALSRVLVTAWSVALLCAQSPSTAHHPILWDLEFGQPPNLYTPEMAVIDSSGVLWVLCGARMGNEGYREQHVTEAMFRIDEQGKQLSTAELGLPLTQEERLDTWDYRLAPLRNGTVGLVFNKIRINGRVWSYLGPYCTKLNTDGTVGPLRLVADPGPRYDELLGLTNGDLLLAGSDGALLALIPPAHCGGKSHFSIRCSAIPVQRVFRTELSAFPLGH